MKSITSISQPLDISIEIGRRLRVLRRAKGLRQEDLAKHSQASLQAIKNLEKGVNVEFFTFVRVVKELGAVDEILSACLPAPKTLEEVERMNAAHNPGTRARVKHER